MFAGFVGMRGARGRGCKTPHPSLNGMEMQEGKLARAACADRSLDTKTPGATVPGSVAKGNLRSSSCPRCSKAEAEGAWHSPAVLGEAVLMEQRPAVMNHSPGLRVWAALGWRCSALPLHPFLGLNNSTALQRVLQHSPCPRCSLSPPPTRAALAVHSAQRQRPGFIFSVSQRLRCFSVGLFAIRVG